MKTFERYFEQHPVALNPEFSHSPDAIIVIPVFNDPDIFATIDSLCEMTCQKGNIGVIIIVNHSENCVEELKETNRNLAIQLNSYTVQKQLLRPEIQFQIKTLFDVPRKEAGVGFARKTGMDAAAAFLYKQRKTNSPILSLDADTLVQPNYSDSVLCFFKDHKVSGVSIAYAHRLEEVIGNVREAIVKYELYLRYYQLALQCTGHPHAFHCIGSAFAVRADAYVAEGGMNKRQAGEDFYFLQKIISTGRYALLNTTCVYPSARFSDRTPFGTGQAVKQIVEQRGTYPVYHFNAFRDLKILFQHLNILYKAEGTVIDTYLARQPESIQHFLTTIDGRAIIIEANANSASLQQFIKRFFDHFNAFRVLKYLNQAHHSFYQKTDITEAIETLFQEQKYPTKQKLIDSLYFLRKIEQPSAFLDGNTYLCHT